MTRKAEEDRVLGRLQATELTKEQLQSAKGGGPNGTLMHQCGDYTEFGGGNVDCNESPETIHD